jgi:hypothetical protein
VHPTIYHATNALALLLILGPFTKPIERRDTDLDLSALRAASCSYRGITATYEEIVSAYVLETYAEGTLVSWRADPSPANPDSESLVTAIYHVDLPAAPDARPNIQALRNKAAAQLAITWRYSTLSTTRIEPGNDYARDALETFTKTVDSFIARMVVTSEDIALSLSPRTTPSGDMRVPKGTVLLVEERGADWVEVRQPSTTLRGWVAASSLQSIE